MFVLFYRNEELNVNNSLSCTYTLEEALKLTYVCDQWVDTREECSRQTEFGYQIVAPILPARGNYSAYNKWGLYLKQIYLIYLSNGTF